MLIPIFYVSGSVKFVLINDNVRKNFGKLDIFDDVSQFLHNEFFGLALYFMDFSSKYVRLQNFQNASDYFMVNFEDFRNRFSDLK